jgi:hypothetical protein
MARGREKALTLMRKWHFYDLASGLFTGRVLLSSRGLPTPEQTVQLPGGGQAVVPAMPGIEVPAGCGAIEWPGGTRLDIKARRVNLATGAVEAFQPTAPADTVLHTWAWDEAAERWLPVPTLAAHKRAKLVTLSTAAAANAEADITVQARTFAADAATRDELYRELQFALAAQLDGLAFTLAWEDAAGAAVALSGAQLKGLLRATRARAVDIRAQWRELRAQVVAAADVAGVDAVVWVAVT